MDWTSYHPIEDMHSYLDYLESTFDFVTTESIGKSYEGSDMRIAKVCKGGCGKKPAMCQNDFADIYTNRQENSTIIIGLDSNQSIKSTNRRTDAMNVFKNSFLLQSLHIDNQPTFHHNNLVSESQIDDILCFIPKNAKLDIKFKDILCQKFNSSNLSSHDVVVGEICLPQPIVKPSLEPDL